MVSVPSTEDSPLGLLSIIGIILLLFPSPVLRIVLSDSCCLKAFDDARFQTKNSRSPFAYTNSGIFDRRLTENFQKSSFFTHSSKKQECIIHLSEIICNYLYLRANFLPSAALPGAKLLFSRFLAREFYPCPSVAESSSQ